jgi:hypothetical protein
VEAKSMALLFTLLKDPALQIAYEFVGNLPMNTTF